MDVNRITLQQYNKVFMDKAYNAERVHISLQNKAKIRNSEFGFQGLSYEPCGVKRFLFTPNSIFK